MIAADRPPSELESLDERVRSRLSGGLCVEMKSFDEPLRLKVVEARVQAARALQPNFDVPSAVVRYIANVIQTNGRDLDGAVNRLIAHATLTGVPLSVETAEQAIRDLIRVREPKRVKIEDIQKLVASHYSISRPDILSSRRTATVVRPRQIAMYLSKVLTLRSLPEIGTALRRTRPHDRSACGQEDRNTFQDGWHAFRGARTAQADAHRTVNDDALGGPTAPGVYFPVFMRVHSRVIVRCIARSGGVTVNSRLITSSSG